MEEKVLQCPICGTSINEPSLKCKDYSVSGEMFDIYSCPACLFAMTYPSPSPSEIGKYYQTSDYVSHSETRQGIVNKLYHLVRKENTKDKLKLIDRFSKVRADLLDIGCGTGYFLSVCKKKGWQIEGVEVNEEARLKSESYTGQSIYHSTDELEASGKKFDVITLWHVFEHLHNIQTSFEQLIRLLKPEGLLILALPNPMSEDAIYYKEYWAGYDVPRHLSHFSPVSIRLLYEKYHNIRQEILVPMKFDAYYISILSEGLKGRGKISALLHGLWQGYRSNRLAAKTGRYSSYIYVMRLLPRQLLY
jgi:2-polyprenyl-3-methyl-5-hydroxy-6-metoxy-1,4-benzoquinol methylase